MVILNEVAEASSSSDPSTDYKYDVFISFRGEDTRLSFTSHLYETLKNAKPKLTAFLDNEVIRIGDTLGPELESGIKASRSAIIVLSENYASSSWCLDELVLILEQKRKSNQIVIPIFYHVEPTHVRKQQSSFGNAMEEHIRKMEGKTDGKEKSRRAQKIESWKEALVNVANLKGLDGSTNIIGLALDMRMLEVEKLSGSLQLETDALNKMDNLKLLQLNYVKINGSYEKISKELTWLCMRGFHFKDMPSILPMENLVVLDMSHSNIESFDVSYSISQQLVTWVKGLTGSSLVEKKLLRSLKILDLSFCEQLRSVGGFLELPILEKLIISNCTSLIQVSESIGHCVELVFIDLSNCRKLKVLPSTIGNLKKVKTFLSNGCDNLIIPPEIGGMDTLKRLDSDKVDINSQTSSSTGVEVIPGQLNLFISSLPISLVKLSLKNNNLSTESFPMEVLKNLYLDGNPIISMPSCLSSLPCLEGLSMKRCTNLETIEYPPISLRKLSLMGDFKVRRIVFYPEMSILDLQMMLSPNILDSSWIIEGMIKIQPLALVEDEVLYSLGWSDMVLIKYQHLMSPTKMLKHSSTIQMYYEFGIFSSIYAGKDMPDCISYRSKKAAKMEFTIPASYKVRGFNVCCVPERFRLHSKIEFSLVPLIQVNNITKSLCWTYRHVLTNFSVADDQRLIYLNHWMFGKNEMEAGDHVIVHMDLIGLKDRTGIEECGIDFVLDDVNMEEDVLSYYKSWNHIIGGDLSHFQTPRGDYILRFYFFSRPLKEISYIRQFLT